MPKLLSDLPYKLAYAHGLATTRKFRKACGDAAALQRRLLASILKAQRRTAFGKQFGFAGLAKDVDSYRSSVPLQDYEGHRPWIDRIVAGEQEVLFERRDPLLMFNQTSGTASAPKLIPVTKRWLANYRRTSLLWGTLALRDHPGLFSGKILHITGVLREGCTELGVPIGSASAMHAHSQKRVVRGFYAAPECVFHIKNYDTRYRAIARLAVGESVSLVATANPSTVLRLVKLIDECSEELIQGVFDGTLTGADEIEPVTRAEIQSRLRPDPGRARQLEGWRRGGSGHLRPRDYWPGLCFLANWQGGPLVAYLAEFPDWFHPDVAIRDIGLLASEARMTVPVTDGTASGALDIESHFFEFLPLSEADSENPRTLLAHEVEVGQEYLLVFTTWAGLYRYDIADVVKVTGFLGGNPLVAFQNKGRHMTSITGEKISERQVVEAMTAAGAGFAATPSTFVVYPTHARGESPHYVLAVEGAVSPELAARFDLELGQVNIEYAAKRESGRLGAATIEEAPPGTFEAAKRTHLLHAGTPEQFKHVYLRPERPAYLESPAPSTTG